MKTQTIIQRHAHNIKGVIECFDRVVLFGTYKSIGWPGAMEEHLWSKGITFMDFNKSYANQLRLEVAEHVRKLARSKGLEVRQVNAGERKENIVEQMLVKRGRRPGVICVLGAMERCRHFKVVKNSESGFLGLQWAPGKCQHYYVYLIDPEFGLCHLRIPTWVPFRLQFCCNGHDWLECRMKQAGISFKKVDNCFVHIGDFPAAQALLKGFEPRRLHRRLDTLAREWVAVHRRFGHSLHWSVYQAEWSTDIVFKDAGLLPALYQEIVRTAAIEVGCADIYRFMGKRLHPRSKAEVASRLQTLVQGTRLKHTLGATSLKMYDKAGSVLRIECTTSDVSTFQHRRKVEPRRSAKSAAKRASAGSRGVIKWAPMRKTFYSLGAAAEAMSACNHRYLAHISQWTDRTQERHALRQITASRRDEKERSVRGVNFFRDDDLQFLRALQRGEHHINGLRNRSLQRHLPGWKPAKIGRTLRRFRVLQLLKPVAGTRKYYPTVRGQSLIVAAMQVTERVIIPALAS